MHYEYKIEKNVPLSPKKSASQSRYPYASREPGDSFFVPFEKNADAKTKTSLMYRLSSSAAERAKRCGEKYASRTVEGGVRVWRIA